MKSKITQVILYELSFQFAGSIQAIDCEPDCSYYAFPIFVRCVRVCHWNACYFSNRRILYEKDRTGEENDENGFETKRGEYKAGG